MSRKEITILALRITALYFFILTLAQIAPFITSISFLFISNDQTDIGTKTFFLSGIFPLLIYFLAAGGLWHYAPKLAGLILPIAVEPSPEPGERNLRDTETFCISLLGLFILASAIPSLAKILFATIWPHLDTTFAKTMANPFTAEKKALIPFADIVYLTVRLTIGFWFSFGSQGILGLIRKVRQMGRPA